MLLCVLLPFPVQPTWNTKLIKSCWLDGDWPNPTGHLFQDCLSKLSLSWRTKLWHWLGISATRFHLHFAVQASRVSTSPTEGSVPSQRDTKYTACRSQWWERSSWSRKGADGNSWEHIFRLNSLGYHPKSKICYSNTGNETYSCWIGLYLRSNLVQSPM